MMFLPMWGIMFNTLNNYYHFANFIRYHDDGKFNTVEDDVYIDEVLNR